MDARRLRFIAALIALPGLGRGSRHDGDPLGSPAGRSPPGLPPPWAIRASAPPGPLARLAGGDAMPARRRSTRRSPSSRWPACGAGPSRRTRTDGCRRPRPRTRSPTHTGSSAGQPSTWATSAPWSESCAGSWSEEPRGDRAVTLLDVGSGSGDIARAIGRRWRRGGVRVDAVALDRDAIAARLARAGGSGPSGAMRCACRSPTAPSTW